jgi:uncharacterized phage-associated protein
MGAVDQYDEAKFIELLLYVAEKLADDPEGGATKLNKALWWSETAHLRMHGRPITGAVFQKLPQGPAPRRLVPVRDALVHGRQALVEKQWYRGYAQDRLIPTRSADLDRLSASEREIVDQVIESMKDKNAAHVSDETHQEMGWRMVEFGETIPLSAAFLADEVVVTPAMRQRARSIAERRDESTGCRAVPLPECLNSNPGSALDDNRVALLCTNDVLRDDAYDWDWQVDENGG